MNQIPPFEEYLKDARSYPSNDNLADYQILDSWNSQYKDRERGFGDELSIGVDNTLNSLASAAHMNGLIDDDTFANFIASNYQESAQTDQDPSVTELHEELANEDSGFFKKTWDVLTNPEGVARTVVSQAGNLGLTLGGGAVGAAAGSALPVAGTALGGIAGATAGGTLMEYGAVYPELLAESGIDMTDPESIKAGLSQEIKDAAHEKGGKRALSIGATDLIAMLVTRGMFKLPASQFKKAIKRGDDAVAAAEKFSKGKKAATVGGALTEFASEPVGEKLAQMSVDEDKPEEVWLEAIGGLGSTVALTGAQYALAAPKKIAGQLGGMNTPNETPPLNPETIRQNAETALNTSEAGRKEVNQAADIAAQEAGEQAASQGGDALDVAAAKEDSRTKTDPIVISANDQAMLDQDAILGQQALDDEIEAEKQAEFAKQLKGTQQRQAGLDALRQENPEKPRILKPKIDALQAELNLAGNGEGDIAVQSTIDSGMADKDSIAHLNSLIRARKDDLLKESIGKKVELEQNQDDYYGAEKETPAPVEGELIGMADLDVNTQESKPVDVNNQENIDNKFTPTHELANGTPVIATDEENIWLDSDNAEWDENDVAEIQNKSVDAGSAGVNDAGLPASSNEKSSNSSVTAPVSLGDSSDGHSVRQERVDKGLVIRDTISGVDTLDTSSPEHLPKSVFGNIDDSSYADLIDTLAGKINRSVKIPVGVDESVVDTHVFESARDRAATYIHIFGNTRNAKIIVSKGFNSLGIKGKRVVKRSMLSSLQNPEILKSIVELIPINVMNDLMGEEGSTNDVLNDPSMFLDRLSVDLDDSVVIGRLVDSIASDHPVPLTSFGAEKESALGAGKSAGVDRDSVAAGGASDVDKHESNYSTDSADSKDSDHPVSAENSRKNKKVQNVQKSPEAKIENKEKLADIVAKKKTQTLENEKQVSKPTQETETVDTPAVEAGEEAVSEAKTKESQEKIEDFGEVLHGAKKHTYALREAVSSDIDVGATPLSKSFPQPDYPKLIADGLDPRLAVIMAQHRSEIGTKPRKKGYKLDRWVKSVEAARGVVSGFLNGDMTFDEFTAKIKDKYFGITSEYMSQLADIAEIATDIKPEQVKNLASFKAYKATFAIFEGEKDVSKWVVVNTTESAGWGGMGNQSHFDTKAEALAHVKSKAVNTVDKPTAKRKVKFDLWTTRGEDGVYLGKKIAARKYIELNHFETAKEAREYLAENYDDLVKQLESKKSVRSVRKDQNDPRVGVDHRNGEDVTPKLFSETFGFRGVQFGNWVEGGRRQQDLNNAYDGLLDLADVIGVPPKAISLDGTLGLAFGARGRGGKNPASAHYESGGVNINLTKINGSGSLAHEFFHALDNYFGTAEGVDGFLTETARPARIRPENQTDWRTAEDSDFLVRKEVYDAWQGVTKAIQSETKLVERSRTLDSARSKDYWSTVRELTARSFERYVIGKLDDGGYSSDYLANIISEEAHEAMNELAGENLAQAYAYPLDSEMEAVNKAYDKLFDTLETKESERVNDKGETVKTTALYSRTQGWGDFPDVVIAQRSMMDHPHHEKAKAGNVLSATLLANDIVTDEYAAAVKNGIGDTNPIIVPVVSIEQSGKNKIPLAAAEALGRKLGLDIDTGMIQTSKVSRTGKSGFHRIANQPLFGGEVKDKDYILIDDTIAQGGTLAQLKEHIEANGGNVVLITTLTGKQYSAKIALDPEILVDVREQYSDIENWWKSEFGYDFSGLTQSEARYIAKSGKDAHALRDEIIASRNEGSSSLYARFLHETQQENGLTPSQAETQLRKDKRLAKLLDNGKLIIVTGESDIPAGAELYSAYQDSGYIYEKVRDSFLDRLPEDATVEDVLDESNSFSKDEQAFLRALGKDDWLGFDYPSQAITAVLTEDANNYDPSIRLKATIGRLVNQYFDGQYSKQGAVQGAYLNGKAYVVADGNAETTIASTAYHEILHATLDAKGDSFINADVKAKLFTKLENQIKLARNGKGHSYLDKAIKRAEKANTPEADFLDEVSAYLVTDYVSGVNQPNAVVKWVKEFIAAIKAAIIKHTGMVVGKVDAPLMNELAKSYSDYIISKGELLDNAGTGDDGDEIALASKQGYEGSDKGETKEWLDAAAKGLDMSYEARMERAKAMGFDVDKIWYHGTNADIKAFDVAKGGINTNDNGNIGMFFTLSQSLASDFSRRKWTKDNSTFKSKANVIPAFLSFSNPRVISGREYVQAIGDGREYRKGLIDNGNDALLIKPFTKEDKKIWDGIFGKESGSKEFDAEQVAVINPSQIRSIHAAFDPDRSESSNLLASKDNGQPLFSIAETVQDSELADEMKQPFQSLWQGAKSQAMGVLTLRQLGEVSSRVMPIINKVYMPLKDRMVVEINHWMNRGGEITNKRAKLSSKDNIALSTIQQDATIAGTDPSKPYKVRMTQELLEQKVAAIVEANKGSDGRLTAKGVERKIAYEEMLREEPGRKIEHERLKPLYDSLSPEAKEVYKAELKFHSDMNETRLDVLKERIENAVMPAGSKESLFKVLQEKFESSRVMQPYFPLSRFGDYWVHSEKEGETSFDMFETSSQRDDFEDGLVASGHIILGSGKNLKGMQVLDGVSSAFISDIDHIISSLGDAPMVNEIRKQVYDLYLQTLPDLSARKHFIRRKKTKGFEKDQSKAFADSVQHGSKELGKLMYAEDLRQVVTNAETTLKVSESSKQAELHQDRINDLKGYLDDAADMASQSITKKYNSLLADRSAGNEEVKKWKEYQNIRQTMTNADVDREVARMEGIQVDAKKITRKEREFAAHAVEELRASHSAIMNPNVHPLAQMINSFGFVWFLGLTPAAAMVNITQTAIIAMPMIGAKYGFARANKNLKQATKDFFHKGEDGSFTVEAANLSPDEHKAFDHWYETGLLDNTLAHDTAGIAENGVNNGSIRHKLMNAASFMFHRAEQFNREVTALAAYRSAIQSGESHVTALKFATDTTWTSHFDYTAANRARFLRGSVMRVVAQFKQYSQSMIYLYGRLLSQAFKSQSFTKEEQVTARKALAGILAMQFGLAGAAGLPLAGMAMGIAQLMSDIGGDDDEPFLVEAELRQAITTVLINVFGEKAGLKASDALTNGLVNAFTPANLSSRISHTDLLYRSSDRELEGRSAAYEAMKAIGGVPISYLEMPFVATQHLINENYSKAAETIMPKFAKDVLKGIRYGTEDAKTGRGYTVKDMSPSEVVAQVMGFSSSELAEQYGMNNARTNFDNRLKTRRSKLVDRMVQARQGEGDRKEAQEAINEWNKKHPKNKITMVNIKQSEKGRQRFKDNMSDGRFTTKRYRDTNARFDWASK